MNPLITITLVIVGLLTAAVIVALLPERLARLRRRCVLACNAGALAAGIVLVVMTMPVRGVATDAYAPGSSYWTRYEMVARTARTLDYEIHVFPGEGLVGVHIDLVVALIVSLAALCALLAASIGEEGSAGTTLVAGRRTTRLTAVAALVFVVGAITNSLPVFVVAWASIGFVAWLLLRSQKSSMEGRYASRKAMHFAVVAGIGLIIAAVFLYASTPFADFGSLIIAAPPHFSSGWSTAEPWTSAAFAAGMIAAVCAIARAGLFPAHIWPADAVRGSLGARIALLGLVVPSGLMMLLRFYPMLPVQAAVLLTVTGVVTTIVAGLLAAAQRDTRRAVAHIAIAQSGLVAVALGVGGFRAAVFALVGGTITSVALMITLDAAEHGRVGPRAARRLVAAAAVLVAGAPLGVCFIARRAVITAVWRLRDDVHRVVDAGHGKLFDGTGVEVSGTHWPFLADLLLGLVIVASFILGFAAFTTMRTALRSLPPAASHPQPLRRWAAVALLLVAICCWIPYSADPFDASDMWSLVTVLPAPHVAIALRGSPEPDARFKYMRRAELDSACVLEETLTHDEEVPVPGSAVGTTVGPLTVPDIVQCAAVLLGALAAFARRRPERAPLVSRALLWVDMNLINGLYHAAIDILNRGGRLLRGIEEAADRGSVGAADRFAAGAGALAGRALGPRVAIGTAALIVAIVAAFFLAR